MWLSKFRAQQLTAHRIGCIGRSASSGRLGDLDLLDAAICVCLPRRMLNRTIPPRPDRLHAWLQKHSPHPFDVFDPRRNRANVRDALENISSAWSGVAEKLLSSYGGVYRIRRMAQPAQSQIL